MLVETTNLKIILPPTSPSRKLTRQTRPIDEERQFGGTYVGERRGASALEYKQLLKEHGGVLPDFIIDLLNEPAGVKKEVLLKEGNQLFLELEKLIPGITALLEKLNTENPEGLLKFYRDSRELGRAYEQKFSTWILESSSTVSAEDRSLKEIYDHLLTEALNSISPEAWGEKMNITHRGDTYRIPKSDLQRILNRVAASAVSELRKKKFNLNENDEKMIKSLGHTHKEYHFSKSIYPSNSNHEFYILRKFIAQQNPDSIHNLILIIPSRSKKLSSCLESDGILLFSDLYASYPTLEQLSSAVLELDLIDQGKIRLLVKEMKKRGYYQDETPETIIDRRINLEKPQNTNFEELEKLIPGIAELAEKLKIQSPGEFLKFYRDSRNLASEYEKKFEVWINKSETDVSIEDQSLKAIYDRLLTQVLQSISPNTWGKKQPIFHAGTRYLVASSDFLHITGRLADLAISELRKNKSNLSDEDEKLIKSLGFTQMVNLASQSTYSNNLNHIAYILRRFIAKQDKDSIHNLMLNSQLNNKLSYRLENINNILLFSELHSLYPTLKEFSSAILRIDSFGTKKLSILVTEMKERGYYQDETPEIVA